MGLPFTEGGLVTIEALSVCDKCDRAESEALREREEIHYAGHKVQSSSVRKYLKVCVKITINSVSLR